MDNRLIAFFGVWLRLHAFFMLTGVRITKKVIDISGAGLTYKPTKKTRSFNSSSSFFGGGYIREHAEEYGIKRVNDKQPYRRMGKFGFFAEEKHIKKLFLRI